MNHYAKLLEIIQTEINELVKRIVLFDKADERLFLGLYFDGV
jgi:hypothetical protein